METPPPSPALPSMDEPAAPRAGNTITFQRPHLYAVLLPLAFVLGLAVGYLFWGRARETAAGPQAASPTQPVAAAQADTPTRYDIPVDGDPAQGPADAPITLVEFSDYQCPYCKKWHQEVLKTLMDAYPGKIRFVYRDFPLVGMHDNAAPAAEAANCAGDQDKYWDFSDKLFAEQANLGEETYRKIADELALDSAKFNECLTSRKYQDEVQADYDFAANLGIRSTPTFFINGLALVGAQPIEVFKQVIDQELAGKIPG